MFLEQIYLNQQNFKSKQKINISKQIETIEYFESNRPIIDSELEERNYFTKKNNFTSRLKNQKHLKKSYNSRRRNGLTLNENSKKKENVTIIKHKSVICVAEKRQNFNNRCHQSIPLNSQIKAARQLAILLSAFIITWLPYFVSFMVIALCPRCVPVEFMTITTWLGYTNSAINPVLYALSNSSYKNSFKRMLNLRIHDKKKFMPIMNLQLNYK